MGMADAAPATRGTQQANVAERREPAATLRCHESRTCREPALAPVRTVRSVVWANPVLTSGCGRQAATRPRATSWYLWSANNIAGYAARSRGPWFETVFVMQIAKNRLGDDFVTVANAMAGQQRRNIRGMRNAGAETRVRTPAIVMRDPLLKDASEMTLVQRNQPVQAFAPNRANQSFAERVRLRRSHRRLEDRQTHRHDCPIDIVRVDAVVVVNEETMRFIAGHHHAELLDRPFRRRMFGHIPVADPSSANL